MAKRVIDLYVHSSKESVGELLYRSKIKLSPEAESNAIYMGYEVKLSYQLDTETGENEIVAVDDMPVDNTRKFVREQYESCNHDKTNVEMRDGIPVKHTCEECGAKLPLPCVREK